MAQQSVAATGAISGTVVAEDGVALDGATVYLLIEHGGCPSVVETTDADGRFAFRGAQAGTYRLRAEKAGYLTQMYGEQQTGPHGFGRAVILTSVHPRQSVEMVLPRAAGTISGTVYGEDGRPLPTGGYVFFEDEQHHDVSTTGLPNGRFSVSNLPPGRYYVSAKRYSAAARQVVGDEWYYPGTTDKQLAELVTLGDAPTYVDIHFGRPELPSIMVTVRTEQGRPLLQAEVRLKRLRANAATGGVSDNSTWEDVRSVRTDAGGSATIAGLKSGRYCAFVAKVPAPFSTWRSATAAPGSLDSYVQSVDIDEGGAPVHLDFVVKPGATLIGRFVMRDGGAPPRTHGVKVDVSSAPFVGGFRGDMSFIAEPSHIDNDGFEIEGLIPGESYTIREFDTDPLKPFVIVGMLMNGAALRGDDIVAASLGEPARIEVILDRAAVVSGTVRNRKISRVTLTRVAGAALAALSHRTMTTDVVGGRFVVRGLPPGDYDISPDGGETRRIHLGAGDLVDMIF